MVFIYEKYFWGGAGVEGIWSACLNTFCTDGDISVFAVKCLFVKLFCFHGLSFSTLFC